MPPSCNNDCRMNNLPEEIVHQILFFCDLVSLWSFGMTCADNARIVFHSKKTGAILRSLKRGFEARLRCCLSSDARIRLRQLKSNHASCFVGRTASGRILSAATNHLNDSHRFEVHISFESFLRCDPPLWFSKLFPGQLYCSPVIHGETIVFAINPTELRIVSLDSFKEYSHTLSGGIRLWTMVLIPSSIRPSLLITSSSGWLHFPNIFTDHDLFQWHIIYTRDWALYSPRPVVTEWNQGGCLIAFVPAILFGPGELRCAAIVQFQNGEIRDIGVIPFQLVNYEMALHQSGVVALSSGRTLYVWRIGEEDGSFRIFPVAQNGFILKDRLIYLHFLDRTLLGITRRGTSIGWDVEDGSLIGCSRLVMRMNDGPMKDGFIMPHRGSFVIMSGDSYCSSMHEWTIGTAFLDITLS